MYIQYLNHQQSAIIIYFLITVFFLTFSLHLHVRNTGRTCVQKLEQNHFSLKNLLLTIKINEFRADLFQIMSRGTL